MPYLAVNPVAFRHAWEFGEHVLYRMGRRVKHLLYTMTCKGVISPIWLTAIVLCAHACTCTEPWIDKCPAEAINSDNLKCVCVALESFSSPEMMTVLDSSLIVVDNNIKEPLNVFNLNDTRRCDFILKGRADGEVLNINQVFRSSPHLFVCDNFKGELYKYSIDADTLVRISKQNVTGFSSIVASEDTLAGILNNGEARYGIKAGGCESQVKTFGDYSEYGVSNNVGWGLTQGHMAINTSLGLFATFSYYTAAFDIADYRNAVQIHSEAMDMSTYDSHSDHFATMRMDSKIGFISVASTDSMIYTVYDGKPLSYYMANRGKKTYGQDICIFDWSGNYIRHLRSELPIKCIAHDKNEYLYLCIQDKEEYRLCRLAI